MEIVKLLRFFSTKCHMLTDLFELDESATIPAQAHSTIRGKFAERAKGTAADELRFKDPSSLGGLTRTPRAKGALPENPSTSRTPCAKGALPCVQLSS